MPSEITGTPVWVNAITTPGNGDPVDGPGWEEAMTDAASRDAFLNIRTPYAAYTVNDGSAVASPLPLTEALNVGGFVLEETDTAIHVPSAGWYELVVTGRASCGATGATETLILAPEIGNTVDGYNFVLNNNLDIMGGTRFSNFTGHLIPVGGSMVFQVVDPATDFIHFIHSNVDGAFVRVQIRKIANP